jgi:TonB-linked SusC/RagA family outer membrane protein
VRGNFLPLFGLDPTTPFNELPDTDWFDFNYRTGVSQDYNATISGGTESSRYRVSAGYENTDGYIRENNFQNYSLSGNFDQQLTDKLSSQVNINLSSQQFVGPCQDGFFINCPISQSAFTSPLARPFLEDGSFSPFFPLVGAQNNPAIQLSENRVRETDVLQILGSLSATYNFYEWLSLTSRLGLDFRQENETFYSSAIANPADNGSLTEITAPTTNFITTTTLNFDRPINESNTISGLLGVEYRRDYTSQFSASGIGFPNPLFRVLNSTAEPTAAAGFNNEFRNAGYFAQLKYNYDNRYRVNFTARYDGSSRFGSDTRFGFFPSGSVAWTVSEEDFFNIDFISDLKLRAGYGVTGNSNIGLYAARGLYNTAGSYSGATALRPNQLANQELSWERAVTANLGLDYELFNGRIYGSIDAYRRNTTDLLLGQPLPGDSGFGSITRNIGEVQNQGLEFVITSVNVQTRDFSWSTRFNISFNENEVIALSENEEALNPASIQPVQVGRSIDEWRVIRYAGVNPADGRPIWYDADGELTYTPDFDDDAQFFGRADETGYGGIGNTFSYKGFSLRAFFQFGFGQRAIPQQVTAFGLNQVGGSFTNGVEQRLTEAWRQPGDIATYPAPTRAFTYAESSGYFITSSDKLYETDYVRLKDVTVSYNLPSSITERAGLGNLRLYVSGLNLVTWTSYIGFDPEVAGDVTSASIPVGRTIRGGVQIQF